MQKQYKELFITIQDMLKDVDINTKENNRILIIQLLQDFYNELYKSDARGLDILEFAKIFDLLQDVKDVIKYLETGHSDNNVEA